MTTIVSVRRNGQVVIGGDGQVSLGKHRHEGQRPQGSSPLQRQGTGWFRRRHRRRLHPARALRSQTAGPSGQPGARRRGAGQDWRTDRALRRLEALLAVADEHKSFIITGNGDVVQPEHDLIAIGSGGNFAQSAAIALLENTELDAKALSRSPSRLRATSASSPTATTPSKCWIIQLNKPGEIGPPNKGRQPNPIFQRGGPCRPGYRNAIMSEMT